MKRLCLFLIAALGCRPVYAQVLAQQMGTPSGTLFTESFGDNGAQPCGYGAPWNLGLYQYTGCNAIWGSATVGAGGSIAIAPSPGSTSYPRGEYSLKVVTGTASTYLSTQDSHPPYPRLRLSICNSRSTLLPPTLSANNAQPIYTLLSTPGENSFACLVDLHSSSSGTIAVHGVGSSSSSDTANITLNADHVVFMHCVPGGASGSSYVTLDGGSKLTFTANAKAWTTQVIGPWEGNLQSITYYIGNVLINSAVEGQGNGPPLFVNFASGSNGTALSAALLNSSTIGGNGSWGACSGGTVQIFSTSAVLNLAHPVDVLGVQYTNSSSTLGADYVLPDSVGDYCPYYLDILFANRV